MSLYRQLVTTPPTITIKKEAKDVVLNLVSAMCDNKSTLRIKKNGDGEFKADLVGQHFGNIQAKHSQIDIEWAADDGNWSEVLTMINTGTSQVQSAQSR
jgi:hypothetical protein